MILLASKSPRRQELLKQIGIDYEVINTDIDEAVLPNEMPMHYVIRIAREKALAAQSILGQSVHPILTADTTVTINGQLLGKPNDRDDFQQMMTLLSGNTHHVLTAIALHFQGMTLTKLSTSSVTFAKLPLSFIDHCWQTGEPCDKAGGYAIQGLMAQYIQRIDGSYSGIMGLPLFELTEALHEIGYNLHNLSSKQSLNK